jgi:hypothetical protein
MERETQTIRHDGQPAHTEEWRQTEPFEEEPLSLDLPGDEAPGTPHGMTEADVELRADIAIWLEPGKLPADRDSLLGQAREAGAPDGVLDALARLPAGRQFGTAGEVVRALGIPTEEPRDSGAG